MPNTGFALSPPAAAAPASVVSSALSGGTAGGLVTGAGAGEQRRSSRHGLDDSMADAHVLQVIG